MYRSLLFAIFLFLFSGDVLAQQESDSLKAGDSTEKEVPAFLSDTLATDTLYHPGTTDDSVLVLTDSASTQDTVARKKMLPGNELRKEGIPKTFSGKEAFFYAVILFLISFALMRTIFSKYFNDLARIFFRRTIKQRQVYELLIQSPLPSILLNLYFVLCGGFYLSFLLEYLGAAITENFWMQFLYCSAALATIYLVKFGSLKIIGWVFNVKKISNDYIFIVFMINKALGVFLLPCIVLIALSSTPVVRIAFYISWIGIGLLLLYRLVLSFGIVRNQVKVNIFHFIIYVIAFEVIPLMLIYKWLLPFF